MWICLAEGTPAHREISASIKEVIDTFAFKHPRKMKLASIVDDTNDPPPSS